MRLRLTAQQAEPADDERETFRGLLVPYDKPGLTSMGSVTVPRGAIELPDDISRVKLLMEHDRAKPVGVLTAAEDSDEGLSITFRFGQSQAGREARQEMLDGTRDGLSVDVDDAEIDRSGRMAAGRLMAAGQVAIPAYSDARGLAAARADTEDEGESMEQPQTNTSTDEQSAEQPAAPGVQPPAHLIASRGTHTRPRSALAELAVRVKGAYGEYGPAGVMSTLTAALADITPSGNGAGNDMAGLGIQAMGELWDGVGYVPQNEPMVTERPLIGHQITGWAWTVKPAVAAYAGNKADIPSNAATLDYVTKSPSRLAGGHDLDRVYVDLGDSDVLTSYWRERTDTCAENLDNARATAALAAAGTPGAATSVVDAVLQGTTAVNRPTYAAISRDLWNTELARPADTLPALFTAGNVYGQNGPGFAMFPSDSLPANTVVVGRKSAVDFFSIRPPIRVEAVVVAKAGIDAGVYSYYGDLVRDASKVRAYTVTVTPLGQATAETGGKSRK